MNEQQKRLFKMTPIEACNDLFAREVMPLLKAEIPKSTKIEICTSYIYYKCDVVKCSRFNTVPVEKLRHGYKELAEKIKGIKEGSKNAESGSNQGHQEPAGKG
jgi:hypothetical protein